MELDALSAFFDRIQLRGRLFYYGTVKGTLELEKPPGAAFIHIVKHGGIDLIRRGHPTIKVDEPSLMLCPYECRYKLHAQSPKGAELVCASFEFGASMGKAFPLGVTETQIFPFRTIKSVIPAVNLLLEEFQSGDLGQSKALGVLFEYVLILLVRTALHSQMIDRGVLQALQDPRLGAALGAIHQDPAHPWSVVELAGAANMSRSSFSEQFARLIGVSPIAYLASWRMKLAKDLMKQGVRIQIVASRVGYGSQAAFTRAFAHEVGIPPREWLAENG